MDGIRKNIGILVCILFLGLMAHGVVLKGSWKSMDDEFSVVKSEQISSASNIKDILTSSFFGGSSYYRPLVTLTFMKDRYFFGLNAFYFYLKNLLFHLGTTVIVFFIFHSLFQDRTKTIIATTLFTIHPVHWEVLSNISGRAILLCAFLYLLSFLLFIHASKEKSRPWLFFFSLFSFLLALLSKESAVTLPLVLFCYSFYCGQESFKKCLSRTAPFFVLTGFYLILRRVLGIVNVTMWDSFEGMFLGVATFLRGCLTYFQLMFFPVNLRFDRSRPYFENILEPQLTITLVALLIILVLLLQRKKYLNAHQKFLLLWVPITFLPVSQIIPIVVAQGHAAVSEHFLYLPSLGLIGLSVSVLVPFFRRLAEKGKVSSQVLRLMTGGIFIFFIMLAVTHNLHALDESVMFAKTLKYNEENTRVRFSYALSLAKKGKFKEAEGEFFKVLKIEPWNERARISLGKAMCDQNKCLEALNVYEQVRDPGRSKQLLEENMRLTLEVLVRQYQRQINDKPNSPQLFYSLGIMYSKLNRWDESLEQYQRAVELKPDYEQALFNLAVNHQILGKNGLAISFFVKVLNITEDSALKEEIEGKLKNLKGNL